MSISPDKREVTRNNRQIKLTFTEFEILNLLAQNSGKVFSKEQIYNIVWKEPYSGDYNIVMSHIRNIREVIKDAEAYLAEYMSIEGEEACSDKFKNHYKMTYCDNILDLQYAN